MDGPPESPPRPHLYVAHAIGPGAIRVAVAAHLTRPLSGEHGYAGHRPPRQALIARHGFLEVVEVTSEGGSVVRRARQPTLAELRDVAPFWPVGMGSGAFEYQMVAALADQSRLALLWFDPRRSRLETVTAAPIPSPSPYPFHHLTAHPSLPLIAVASLQSVVAVLHFSNHSLVDRGQPPELEIPTPVYHVTDAAIWSVTFLDTPSNTLPLLAVLVVPRNDSTQCIHLLAVTPEHEIVHLASLSTCGITPENAAMYRATQKLAGHSSTTPPPPPRATGLRYVRDCPGGLIIFLEGRLVVANVTRVVEAAGSERADGTPIVTDETARLVGLSTQPLLNSRTSEIRYLIVPPHVNFAVDSATPRWAAVPGLVTASAWAERSMMLAIEHGDFFVLRLGAGPAAGGALLPGTDWMVALWPVSRAGACTSIAPLAEDVVVLGNDGADGSVRKLVCDHTGTMRLEMRQEIMNLSPMVDFCFSPRMDEMYTCGGMGRFGTIRVIRNGMGVQTVSSSGSEFLGCANVWTIRLREHDRFDALLVFSFAESTRVMGVGGEVGLVDISSESGFVLDTPTLSGGRLSDGLLAQVHPNGVRVVGVQLEVGSLRLTALQDWSCSDEQIIGVAAIGSNAIAAGITQRGGGIFLAAFRLEAGSLVVHGLSEITAEASCIDIAKWSHEKTLIVLTGTYNSTLEVRRFNESLELVAIKTLTGVEHSTSAACPVQLSSTELPRSCVVPESVCGVEFNQKIYVMLGLRDGAVVQIPVDIPSYRLGRTTFRYIGTRPVRLNRLWLSYGPAILALSDSGWLIHHEARRIAFTRMSHPPMDCAAAFSAPRVEMTVAAVSEGILKVLALKRPSSVSVSKIHLRETPKRIMFHEHDGMQYLVVATSRFGRREHSKALRSELRVFSLSRWRFSGRLALEPQETVQALCSWNDFIVVGTAFDIQAFHNTGRACPRGRLLVLTIVQNTSEAMSIGGDRSDAQRDTDVGSGGHDLSMEVVCELHVGGAALCAHPFGSENRYLLVSVNEFLFMFQIDGGSMRELARMPVRQCIVSLSTNSTRIAVADRKDSIGLLQYDEENHEFHQLRWDHKKRLISDCVLLDKCTVAGVDKLGGLLTLGLDMFPEDKFMGSAEDNGAETAPGFARNERNLRTCHLMNIGTIALRVRLGALRHPYSRIEIPGVCGSDESRDDFWGSGLSICAATLDGGLVTAVPLSSSAGALLGELQQAMLKSPRLAPLFRNEHCELRSVMGDGPEGVVDGDFLSQFGDLESEEQLRVVQEIDLERVDPSMKADFSLVDHVARLLDLLENHFFNLNLL